MHIILFTCISSYNASDELYGLSCTVSVEKCANLQLFHDAISKYCEDYLHGNSNKKRLMRNVENVDNFNSYIN